MAEEKGNKNANIVTITTVINPYNTDGELVAVYSKVPLTEADVEELHKEYKNKEITRSNLVELPSCLGWNREDFPEVSKIDTNLSKATGLFCYIVGGLS
jgi:hypothetical protein